MDINYHKLTPNAQEPKKAHATDAGLDLVATSKHIDNDGNVVYGTGIAVEIPIGYCGKVYPRSSNAKKQLILTNGVGVIDAGYRGEILLKFKRVESYYAHHHTGEQSEWQVGDRIAQLIIEKLVEVTFVEVDTLGESERGDGGYGSSGV